jgi:hypothetical protein
MRALVPAIVLFVLAAGVSSPSARQSAALSGTWTASSDAPPGMPAAPGPTFGPRFGIRVEGDAVTVERLVAGQTLSVRLPLDGSRVRSRVAGRECTGDQEIIETATREDGGIALTRVGTVPSGGGPVRESNARLLIRPGDAETVVVQIMMAQRGGEPYAVGTVYRRSPEPLPSPPPRIDVTRAGATIAQLAWLAGTWSGVNGPSTTEERWTPGASGAMLGLGRSLRGAAQASFEFLCIAEREGGLVYTAWPNARPAPTYFVLTAISDDSATFENPSHDYPQLVRYTRRADGALETTISLSTGQQAATMVLQRQ